MNNFLRNILFFIISAILMACFIAIYNYSKFKYEFSQLKSVNTLVIGDSHSYRGINPSFFDKGYSIAMQAEPLVVTYWKYKEFLKHQQPNKVLISLSPHSLSAFQDVKFNDTKYVSEMFRRTSFIGDYENLKNRLEIDNKKRRIVFLRENFIKPQLNYLNVKKWGGYVPFKDNFKDNSDTAIKRHFYLDSMIQASSLVQKDYLDSIVNLSEKNNIQLTLVGTPLYQTYFNKIPIVHKEAYESVKVKYKNRVIFYDKSNDQEFEKYHFSDADHLNQKGAEKLSQSLAKYLEVKSVD